MKENRNFNSNNPMSKTKTFVKKEQNFMRTEKDLNSSNNNSKNNKTFIKKENRKMQKSMSPCDVKNVATELGICTDDIMNISVMTEEQFQAAANAAAANTTAGNVNTEKYKKNLSYDKALTANWEAKQAAKDAAADAVPKEFKSSRYIKLDAGNGVVKVPGLVIKNNGYNRFTVQLNISYEVDGKKTNKLTVGNKTLCHNQLISCYLGGNIIESGKKGGKSKDKKKSGRNIIADDSVVVVIDKSNVELGRIVERI